MKKVASVGEYIENAPEEVRGRLRELRKAIKEAVPEAEEKISYAMPYYGYKGRLVYFAAAKNHIGLYIMTPTVEMFKKELEKYKTTGVTIQFPLDEELPIPLIKRMVKARAKIADEREKEKSV